MQSAAKCPFLLTFKCAKVDDINFYLKQKTSSKQKKNPLIVKSTRDDVNFSKMVQIKEFPNKLKDFSK